MNKRANKGTILIVDDVPNNLRLLMNFLHDLNFVVRIAQNGEEALEQVAYEKPDIILLDIMMPPGIDGFETCRRLKANEDSSDIPVIFMTALSETINKVKGFEVGAVDYITKPFQQEEVLARITAHLTIKKQQELLEQQNGELEAFAHTVAHDLKNPLGVILGFSNLVTRDLACSNNKDSKAYKYSKKIQQTSRKMANIIDALLLLSSARSQEIQMKPVNMSEIITNVQQRLKQMIKEYQAEIVTPTIWPIALGYAPWIEEIWVNYISNALKYGGKPPLIELGASPDEEGYIKFWVSDNGKGLTEEEQKKLFIPFSRINQISIEGHGLGLSIVQRIVEKCAGEVGVESKIDQGSIFYFSLEICL